MLILFFTILIRKITRIWPHNLYLINSVNMVAGTSFLIKIKLFDFCNNIINIFHVQLRNIDTMILHDTTLIHFLKWSNNNISLNFHYNEPRLTIVSKIKMVKKSLIFFKSHFICTKIVKNKNSKNYLIFKINVSG